MQHSLRSLFRDVLTTRVISQQFRTVSNTVRLQEHTQSNRSGSKSTNVFVTNPINTLILPTRDQLVAAVVQEDAKNNIFQPILVVYQNWNSSKEITEVITGEDKVVATQNTLNIETFTIIPVNQPINILKPFKASEPNKPQSYLRDRYYQGFAEGHYGNEYFEAAAEEKFTKEGDVGRRH